MQSLLKFAMPTLFSIFAGWYFYHDHKQTTEFNKKMDQIDAVRKSLMDSITNLQQRTKEHDEKLRKALTQNMQILDTLNSSLIKVNKNSKIIDDKINEQRKTIDDLWKDN